MARLNPPSSTAVVDVPDEQVEAFKAQGWTAEAAPALKKASARSVEK